MPAPPRRQCLGAFALVEFDEVEQLRLTLLQRADLRCLHYARRLQRGDRRSDRGIATDGFRRIDRREHRSRPACASVLAAMSPAVTELPAPPEPLARAHRSGAIAERHRPVAAGGAGIADGDRAGAGRAVVPPNATAPVPIAVLGSPIATAPLPGRYFRRRSPRPCRPTRAPQHRCHRPSAAGDAARPDRGRVRAGCLRPRTRRCWPEILAIGERRVGGRLRGRGLPARRVGRRLGSGDRGAIGRAIGKRLIGGRLRSGGICQRGVRRGLCCSRFGSRRIRGCLRRRRIRKGAIGGTLRRRGIDSCGVCGILLPLLPPPHWWRYPRRPHSPHPLALRRPLRAVAAIGKRDIGGDLGRPAAACAAVAPAKRGIGGALPRYPVAPC